MISRPIALLALTLCASLAAHGAPPPLCPGLKGRVVEDQQVKEDQLTHEAALKALSFIEQHKATTDATAQLGLANSEIRVRGYVLRSFATSTNDAVRKKYRMEFCQWLETAAWFD